MKVYYASNKTRSFHILIENIALYLNKYMGAELCESKDHRLNFSGVSVHVADPEMLIHDESMDCFYGVSFSDNHTNLMTFFLIRNSPNDTIVISQTGMTPAYSKNHKFKAKSCIYIPSEPYINLDEYYIRRKYIKQYIDQFIFRGNCINADRKAVGLLQNEPTFTGGEYIPNYFETIINYKVGLSIPGTGEFCYRDVEYMAIGIPMMRFKYFGEWNPPLIPNYHYISIDRIDLPEDKNFNGGTIARERCATQIHADAYVKRFKEVKDDQEFLNFISDNARKYYNEFLHPVTRVQHMINILNIQ